MQIICTNVKFKKYSSDKAALLNFFKGQTSHKAAIRMPKNPAGTFILCYSFIACFYTTNNQWFVKVCKKLETDFGRLVLIGGTPDTIIFLSWRGCQKYIP